ncbi:MAG: T9SS type A sorting domain-containing protein, partial [Cyclobacteriaceae bacterium]
YIAIDAAARVHGLKVYDMRGRQFRIDAPDGDNVLNIGHLPTGIYLITGYAGKELFQVRIIKY